MIHGIGCAWKNKGEVWDGFEKIRPSPVRYQGGGVMIQMEDGLSKNKNTGVSYKSQPLHKKTPRPFRE
jgi:hypothetical protein